jgi:mRNA degradation ribonuclease J1/J2
MKAEDTFILQTEPAGLQMVKKPGLKRRFRQEMCVDGFLVGEIGERVMQDRERLAQDGFVVVNVPIDKQRRLAGEPLFLTRGFTYE